MASNRRKASQRGAFAAAQTDCSEGLRPPSGAFPYPPCTLRPQLLVGGCGTVGSYEREDKPDRCHLCTEDEAELRPKAQDGKVAVWLLRRPQRGV